MRFRKNTWCPKIQAACKGSLCVCHEVKGKVDYSKPNNHREQPFCNQFQVYLPKDIDEVEDDGS